MINHNFQAFQATSTHQIDSKKSSKTGEIRVFKLANIANPCYNLGDILELEYKGMRIPNGDIDSTVSLDIMINYHYVLIKGVYKE